MSWTQSSLDDLQGQLADRLDMHSMLDWSPELLGVVIAVLDAYLGGGIQDRPAAVLELVKR
jgi:hypothetical protein